MRLIDADALLTDRRMRMYYHLPNGDIAVPVIDIEHAPTIEERKWIPCSERLPEDNGNYLVTYIYKDDEKGTEEPYVISDNFMLWKDAFATEEPTDKAQAWMPLPEPYREEATDETP